MVVLTTSSTMLTPSDLSTGKVFVVVLNLLTLLPPHDNSCRPWLWSLDPLMLIADCAFAACCITSPSNANSIWGWFAVCVEVRFICIVIAVHSTFSLKMSLYMYVVPARVLKEISQQSGAMLDRLLDMCTLYTCKDRIQALLEPSLYLYM